MLDVDFANLEAYSCEDICKSCKFSALFGEYCPCALNITCIGYDDKGSPRVVAWGSDEKTKGGLTNG